jgi:exopolysaccharide biosynthesis polyprenyl glycosylphosphotransferase
MTAVDESRVDTAPAADRRRSRVLRSLLTLVVGADLLVLAFSAVLSWNLRNVVGTPPEMLQAPQMPGHLVGHAWPVIVVVWVAVLAAEGGYYARNFGAGPEEFRAVASAAVTTAGLVGLTCYLARLPLSRAFVILIFAIGTPLLLIERYVVRQMVHRARKHGRLLHRVIAVGGPSGIREVIDALARSRYLGYHVIGACVPGGPDQPDRLPVPVLGVPAEARRLCDETGADTVLVARGGYATSQDMRRIAWDLEGSNIDLVVVPSLTDVAGPRIHMRPVAGLPLLHVEQPQAGAAGGIAKRLFDVAASGGALLLLSPLLLVVAAVVKAQDGGPVFFRQARVGRAGRRFGMLKFRSMVVDAESRLADLLEHNDLDGVLFKMKADPRITRVGRFLRRYSIDELPQLLNVLRGEMSLVGPRPPLPSEVDQYARDTHRRLLVRPGLTGLWQVSGRSRLSWEESVRLDLYYVDNWSMMTDVVIMAKTVRAVLRSDGAY